MPRTVPCPTCTAPVPVPSKAEPGHEVTCPGCEEKFVPPGLQPVPHDPQSSESYGFVPQEEAEEVNVERKEKKKRVKAIEAAALADEKVKARAAGKTVAKVIVVPGKLVNLVVR